jgi:hypothetical protein
MRTRGFLYFCLLLVVVPASLILPACGDRRRGARMVAPAVAMPEVAPARPRELSPLPKRPLSPRLERLRARAAEQATRGRGLGWLGPVAEMTELSGWEYGARTREISDALLTEDLKVLSRLAAAGGMLPEGTDLAALAASFTAATASATYSPLDKRVLVVSHNTERDDERTTALLTHEYVHALQDQHFDLLKLMLSRPFDFDRSEALFALVEGDAMSVERRSQGGEAFARLSPEEMARREDERYAPYRRGIGALFPPLLTETFIFRYRDGLRFVEALKRARPAVGADQIFRRPPRSTEQVLHPSKYLSDEAPREVSLAAEALNGAGWQLMADTPLGEIGVRGVLMAGASAEEARRAAAGWGGDRAFLFEREGRPPLFIWKTLWDTPTDAGEFFRAYASLRRKGGPAAGTAEGERQLSWSDGGIETHIRLEGDGVIIVRGAQGEAGQALTAASAR